MKAPKVVVVTGAASGIGLGISRRFARDGHAVAMLDTQTEVLEREAGALRTDGARILSCTVDVSQRAHIESAYAAVREHFGPISVVIANAGISGTQPFLTMTTEKWQHMLDVDLTGVFHTIQAALPDLIANKWGRIVTISSQAGQTGAPERGHYSAAKAGVIGLTKSLARDFARAGITVNTIPPSLVDTPMARGEEKSGEHAGIDAVLRFIPAGRAGTPDDIANACAFLCSDDAAYITGQEINVNGGIYM
jgi:NAD(P)-dependent dehydrogenase (short-subunit alcohol dehydrogenase family)